MYGLGYRLSYSDHNLSLADKILDSFIKNLFGCFHIIYSVMPFIVVLNIVGITHASWWALGGVWIGWYILDFFSDILELLISRHRKNRDEKRREEKRKEREKRYLGTSGKITIEDDAP